MIALAILLAAQDGSASWDDYKKDKPARPNPFDQFDPKPKPEKLGPGPHTLVISSTNGITRMDYKSGAACQKARDAVRQQLERPPSGRGVIYGRPSTSAICVPR